MVTLIRNGLVVGKIRRGNLESTSEHKEWFQADRGIVFEERLFGVRGFPFLLSMLMLKNSEASYDFETALIIMFS
jgi:hypothetical protein